jgi:hypothetical protein
MESRAETLPALLDAKGLQAELGVTRSVAEKLMHRLPLVIFPDVRKVYVRRQDVEALVDASTVAGERRPVL